MELINNQASFSTPTIRDLRGYPGYQREKLAEMVQHLATDTRIVEFWVHAGGPGYHRVINGHDLANELQLLREYAHCQWVVVNVTGINNHRGY
jgi:hypothetical protein